MRKADSRPPRRRVKPDAGEGGERLLRSIIRALDMKAARRAQERLAEAGCEAAAFVGAEAAPPEAEDVLIISGGEGRLMEAAAMARNARARAGRPIALLLAVDAATPPPAGLEAFAPFDGALALDAPPALLARQLAQAVRMGACEEEAARRRATAEAIGAAAPAALDPRRLKALYIGAPHPFFLSLERLIAAHGGLVTAAFSSFTGFDHLHDEAFDAVVLNGVADPQTAVALCAALRRNAALSNLPTLVIAAAQDDATPRQAIERGAVAVASPGADTGAALGWLFDAVRRERRRRAAEHDLLALRDLMGDARTGLFRTDAFEPHIQRLADDHHATGRPLALAALKVLPAHGATPPPEPVWRKGFTEISSLAARLVRDSDCGAAYDGETIVLALPFTGLSGARRVANRVASVAECTAFAAGENGAPVVFEQSIVELQPGESGAGLVARAVSAFAAESVSA